MHISIAAEPIFSLGTFPITNSLITTWIVMALLVGVSFIVGRNLKKIPKGLQNIFEAIIEALLHLVQSIAGEKAREFFPLIATFFLFILTANWIGLVPGVGTIGICEPAQEKTAVVKTISFTQPVFASGEEQSAVKAGEPNFLCTEKQGLKLVPLFRGATADLNTTLALAIISFFLIQYFGVKYLGIAYFAKFINVKKPLDFFVGILETISEFAKILSFAFRLFGNIFAGEVLLTVISSLIPVLAPLPFYGLELFVGFIQALVFSMLSLVFYNVATISHEKH